MKIQYVNNENTWIMYSKHSYRIYFDTKQLVIKQKGIFSRLKVMTSGFESLSCKVWGSKPTRCCML
jgi:hypothetical protein